MHRPTIMIVDDDPEVIKFFSYLLESRPYKLVVANSGAEANKLMAATKLDLALVDLKLPDVNGIDILEQLKGEQPECQVIIMTGYSTTKTAVNAIQFGAYDYIDKPFEDIDDLEKLIEKALLVGKGTPVNNNDWSSVCQELGLVLGENKKMLEVYTLAAKIATKDLTVLITGETGTGKDLMARFLHRCSKRRDQPFFAINCGAVVESLLESELFGHEKGAFTGAGQQRKGILQLANKGTLFLDEIGEASPAIQVKLLRALETGEFLPVGGEKKLYSDVRIVAATNVNLEDAVQEKTFRRDLFFRLDVVRINLPNLKERRDDIPVIIDALLAKKAVGGNAKPQIAMKTILRLKEYSWPGNIRELVNVIEQAVALADGNMILPKHLPEKVNTPHSENVIAYPSLHELVQNLDSYDDEQLTSIYRDLEHLKKEIQRRVPQLRSLGPMMSMEEMERVLISDTMERCNGNITLTAKILGVGRNTLYRKIEKLNL